LVIGGFSDSQWCPKQPLTEDGSWWRGGGQAPGRDRRRDIGSTNESRHTAALGKQSRETLTVFDWNEDEMSHD
jgi:hypothetical protein